MVVDTASAEAPLPEGIVHKLMKRRAAFAHPGALGLLASTVILLVATFVVPALRSWADRSPWILLWGVLAYAAAVLVISRSRPEPAGSTSAELRQLRAIRHAISTLIGESKAVEASQLGGVLAQAVERIDFDIAPSLQELAQRHRMLSRDLARYERRELPMPEPAVLNRLWTIHHRQRVAIDDCVQQAANAQAALVALLREGDSRVMAERAHEWVDDLLVLHDALDEVLRGGDEFETAISPHERRTSEPLSGHPDEERGDLPLPPSTVAERAVVADAAAIPNGRNGEHHALKATIPYEPVPPGMGQIPDERLFRLVDEGLRRLQNPGALANCELIQWLPLSLAAVSAHAGADQTPLRLGRALRQVLDAAIEQLADPGGAETLPYDIIHEEYQVGRSNKEIVARHHISESTLHRYRREAILVLARELRDQEAALAHQRNGRSSGQVTGLSAAGTPSPN